MIRKIVLSLFGLALLTPAAYAYQAPEVPACQDNVDVFPKDNSFRHSFSRPWQKNYPELIYNAQTGKRYWYDPSQPKQSPKEITSLFTPITYSTEKLLVRVCGLHFLAKTNIAPTTKSVPGDGMPILGTPDAGFAKALSTSKLENFLSALEKEPSCKPKKGLAPCKKVKAAEQNAMKAIIAFEEATQKVNTFLEETMLNPDSKMPGTFPALQAAIQTELSSEPSSQVDSDTRKKLDSDPVAFDSSYSRAQRQQAELADAISSYNKTLQNQEFVADWSSLAKASKSLVGARTKYIAALEVAAKGRHCSCKSGIDWNEELQASEEEYNALETSFRDARTGLMRAEKDIAAEFRNLNEWYDNSEVSQWLYLDPVAGNSLTQIDFQVTDTWKPLKAPVFDAVVTPGATPAEKKPDKLQIGMEQKDANSIVMTFSQGSVPGTSVNVTTPAPSPGSAGSHAIVQVKNPLGGKKSSSNTDSAKPASDDGTPALSASLAPTLPDASEFVERHRFINFVPSGGLLVTRFTQQIVGVETLPTTITTTTVIVTSPTTTPPVVTVAQTSGTAVYATSTANGPLQQTAVAGFTWYPFGRDTYPVSKIARSGRPRAAVYADALPLSRFGIFAGTSVTSLGTFYVGPSYEVVPGVQILAGTTLTQRNSLAQNIIPCAQLGPTSSTSTSSTTSTSPTGITTTTTVTVQTAGNCATPNVSLLGGTNAPPMNSTLKPAFGFGLLFNSNLFKLLGVSK